MPRLSKKPKKNHAKLAPGFTQSRAAYKQVHAHLTAHLGKHPHFHYNMSEFQPGHTLSLLDTDTGKLLAFCTLNPSIREASTPSKNKKKKQAQKEYLQIGIMEVVDEAQRGKGLGRRMLDQIVAIARQGGFKCLRTFAITTAAEFYRKYGFVTDLSMIQHEMNVRFDLLA